MRAFVEMRKFISNNAALLDLMATIEYRQLEYQRSTDERFDRVFGYLDAHSLPEESVFAKLKVKARTTPRYRKEAQKCLWTSSKQGREGGNGENLQRKAGRGSNKGMGE